MQLIAAQLAQAGLIKMERPPTSVQPTEKANFLRGSGGLS
jgi:hypothetical protein